MSKIYCTPLRGPFGEKLDKCFRRENGFVEVNPGNVIMPRKYSEICDEIIDSRVRKDDVWMISYPRTGEYFQFSSRAVPIMAILFRVKEI